MVHLFNQVIRKTLPPLTDTTDTIRLDVPTIFLLQKVFCSYTDKFKLLIKDNFNNRYWSNIPIWIDNFAGTPEYPAKFLKSFAIPVNSMLEYRISNPNTDPIDLELCFQGQNLDTFTYPKHCYQQIAIDFNLPAQQKITNFYVLNLKGKFAINKLLAYVVNPQVDLMIDDITLIGSIGRSVISGQIKLTNMFGRAVRPNLIPEFTMFPNDVISISITNPTNTDTSAQIVFDGYELYD